MFLLLKIEGMNDVSAIEMPENSTASALCQHIQDDFKIPLHSQNIMFNGVQVPNTSIPLSALGIMEGAELNGNIFT